MGNPSSLSSTPSSRPDVSPDGSPVVRLTARGEPVPKGSRTSGRRRDGSVYTRPAGAGEHDWQETVATTAMWRRSQDAGPLPEPPYRVELTFYLRRPQRPRWQHPSKGDLDKLVRAVLDGLVTGGLLTDDRHVVDLRCSKSYATAPGGEGVFVAITTATQEAA
jgi:Holliday junction resolvase RusA-like endonuclease